MNSPSNPEQGDGAASTGWLPHRRSTRWILLAGLGFLAVIPFLAGLLAPRLLERLFLPLPISPESIRQDYWAFYGGARAGWTGVPANPYDPAEFAGYVGAPSPLLWLYPPVMLLLLAPFGGLPYEVAKVLWVGGALLSSVLLARLTLGTFRHSLLVAFSPLGWVSLFIGQFGAVFGLLLVAGLRFAERRPVLAGACIALLTVKPQYGLLVIPFLIAIRAWKAFRAATALTLLLVLATGLAHGWRTWGWFFESLAAGSGGDYALQHGSPVRITFLNALAGAGLPLPPEWLAYGGLLILAAAGLFRLGGRVEPRLRVAYVLAASSCVAPYFFVYDYFALYGAILLAIQGGRRLAWWHGPVFLAIWIAPVVPLFFVVDPMIPALLWPLNAMGTLAVLQLAAGDPTRAPEAGTPAGAVPAR